MQTEAKTLVIGIVGEKGSGKETFAKYFIDALPEKKIAHVHFSDILAETLTMWDIAHSRHNLQQMAIIMNQGYGLGTLTHAVAHRIAKTEADIVMLDGVRWLSDADMIRAFPNNLLVYVTADVKTRYERTKARKVYVGEESASFETFMKEEQVLTELDIPKIGAKADKKFENNGSCEEFEEKVKIFSAELYKTL